MVILFKTYKLLKLINLYYSNELSLLFLKNSLGHVVTLYFPSYYFVQPVNSNNIKFLFLSKFYYKSFLRHLFYMYNRLVHYFFIRFRITGLGYRIRCLSPNLVTFFFNISNYYYLHVPVNLLVKRYKKRMFFMSNDWSLLKLIFSHLLLLSKIGPYNLRGLRSKKSIILLKKRQRLLS